MIVEPVQIAWRHVESQKIMNERFSLGVNDNLRCGQGLECTWELFGLEFSAAPAQPGQALGTLAGNRGIDVKNTAVEGRSFHHRPVAQQKLQVGLIPPELDQLAGA